MVQNFTAHTTTRHREMREVAVGGILHLGVDGCGTWRGTIKMNENQDRARALMAQNGRPDLGLQECSRAYTCAGTEQSQWVSWGRKANKKNRKCGSICKLFMRWPLLINYRVLERARFQNDSASR